MDAVKNTCGSCKNRYIPSRQEPCNLCSLNEFAPKDERGPHNKWEPSIDFVEKKAAEGIAAVLPALPDSNPKTRFGVTKPSMSCVPPGALIHLMRAMADGRKKYGAMNWREHAVTATIYYDAAMRHLMAWLDGQNVAEDSGVHHLGHAMACLAIVLDAEANGQLNDDRPMKGMFPQLVTAFTEKTNAA